LAYEDQFRIKGIETSMGYVGWLGNIETIDSTFTEILRKLGAVFYGNIYEIIVLTTSQNRGPTEFNVRRNCKQYHWVLFRINNLTIVLLSTLILANSLPVAPLAEKEH
jgi:Amidase